MLLKAELLVHVCRAHRYEIRLLAGYGWTSYVVRDTATKRSVSYHATLREARLSLASRLRQWKRSRQVKGAPECC